MGFFHRWARGDELRLRLICFPHAGAGASAYARWIEHVPHDVEVWAATYPGHEERMHEAPLDSIAMCAATLIGELHQAQDLPFVFFGHSMGALVAFEAVQQLRRSSRRLPLVLYVSGHIAPQRIGDREPIHVLDDDAFLDRIVALGGTTGDLLQAPEWRELLLPLLKTDIAACETYELPPNAAVPCRLVALGGTDDEIASEPDMLAWEEQAQFSFRHEIFAGDHFYLQTEMEDVLQVITEDFAWDLERINCDWQTPHSLRLDGNEIHLWSFCCDTGTPPAPSWFASLSPAERQTASEFQFDVDREKYIVRREMIRRLLAQYLGIAPGEVAFTIGPHGKPALNLPDGSPPLTVNWSESGGLVLLAVTLTKQVGVDCEVVRGVENLPGMIGQVASPAEAGQFEGYSLERQTEDFFDLWTRKEAIAKALGTGLSIPGPELILESVETSHWALRQSGADAWNNGEWRIEQIVPFAGYAGALAYRTENTSLAPSSSHIEVDFTAFEKLAESPVRLRCLVHPVA